MSPLFLMLGASLSQIASLDTLVTVVDGHSFLDELNATDNLAKRGWEAAPEDERTVAQLFVDQLEFANVIILNKIDLLSQDQRSRLKAVIRRFNPKAKLSKDSHYGCKPFHGTRLSPPPF